MTRNQKIALTVGVLAALATIIAALIRILPDIWPNAKPTPECAIAINDLSPAKTNLLPGEQTSVTVTYSGCGSAVTFLWSSHNGQVPSGWTTQSTISYTAPTSADRDIVEVQVQDTEGRTASEQITIAIASSQP